MSHISTVKVQVRDLEALRAACQRLGFEFHEGQQKYAWYGTWVGDSPLPEGLRREDLGTCTHVIHVPGARYEVGVLAQGDHFALLYDFWGAGGLQPYLGKDAGRLVQMYTVEATRAEIARQGMSCWEENLEDGSVRLHVQTGEYQDHSGQPWPL